MNFKEKLEVNDNSSKNNELKLFGTRYLNDNLDVFEHNAWDNVKWDDDREKEALEIIKKQKEYQVNKDIASDLIENPSKQWDNFYKCHEDKFFKDRAWLTHEFPMLLEENDNKNQKIILEVGCGVGNTTLPLLKKIPSSTFIYCSDFSKEAIDKLKLNELYDEEKCCGFVWDITKNTTFIDNESVDIILCIYVLSALEPQQQILAIKNLTSKLKPGGLLLVKDYGRYDLTQLRFKKNRLINENFYCRGDGTLVYFFTTDELNDLFVKFSLIKIQNTIDRRLIDKKKLLKICSETLKLRKFFEELLKLDYVNAVFKKPVFKKNKTLFMVILYELCEGKGYKMIPKKYKEEINCIKTALMISIKEMDNEGRGLGYWKKSMNNEVQLPRYVRINTLKITKEDVIDILKNDGYNIIKLKSSINDDEYDEIISKMNVKDIFEDNHITNLLIFSPNAKIYNDKLVKSKKLILQDKASCLSSFLLSPSIGSSVIDTCAAPGMKTSHLCAIMNNKGHIYAFDRDKKRFNDLKNNLKISGGECVDIFNIDFLKVSIDKKPYNEVEYALVDPPCSGSGMIKRMDSFIDNEEIDTKRLESLGNLQAMILKHAMKLPKLKRIVYSTCSIHELENECVIEEVMKDENIKSKFQLINILPEWKKRGNDKYEFGFKCLRCDSLTSKTNGFFIAVFERI
ncbi:Putative methyltransferase NSUN5 [Strongyloides ratti]|uniref:Putative methyltransferase NSUN5 n=1 Tax=Strongyloides ratti TaxID=34506 RepID=A0A090MTT1_STRRB|nr:Putative methyltransferase NSUN5 [Strongyloides ratti]CEF61738.1 Putative methyltransferase NSUN5 [Strongyloides ratti]